MNLLYTTVAGFHTLESAMCLRAWRESFVVIEEMPLERLASYLKFELASSLALVDAIVCMADAGDIVWQGDPVERALVVAREIRNLPETCTMRDGRKWRSVPFIIFGTGMYGHTPGPENAHLSLRLHPMSSLRKVQEIVDSYHDGVLSGYDNLGILVRFQNGRAQIGPALQRKSIRGENEFYHFSGDQSTNTRWVTMKRDRDGLRHDVELFEELLSRRATETEMHHFFEEHPAMLMEARMGIPISHRPHFAVPKNHRPDFSISPILGPANRREVELMELKGPGDRNLTKGFHPGFTAKVHHAVDQVRDYETALRDPANIPSILEAFGFIPESSKLAILIGRAPSQSEQQLWRRRQSDLDVEIVTYDEILQVQTKQLERPVYTLRSGTPGYDLE